MILTKIRNFSWEILQNIIGFFVVLFSGAKKITTYETATVYSWKVNGGISLGSFICVPYKPDVDTSNPAVLNYIKHEYGHTKQSAMLGPLYLFVIGIPSICWAQFGGRYRAKHNKSYYWFYTEAWADKLGGAKH